MKSIRFDIELDHDELADDAELDHAVLTFFRDEVARPTRQDNLTDAQRVGQAMRLGVARADAADAAIATKLM